jgi:hypothetical protein
MFGSAGIGVGLLALGIIVAAALPGAGLIIGIVIIVLGILMLLGGVAVTRGRTPHPRP